MRLKPASEAEGRRFKSCRARHILEKEPARNRGLFFVLVAIRQGVDI